MDIPLAELLESPEARAANPKLAAYMFAGRAFILGTGLAVTGTLAITMGVASAMGVNNVRRLIKMAVLQNANVDAFYSLRNSHHGHANWCLPSSHS
jgi:hypothetical protein